jgi:membrane fusion protein (multidrug efflux system)
VQQTDANVAAAKQQLSYCTIIAPVNGRIGHPTVDVGNNVNPGQALLAVVQDGLWVTANFKEQTVDASVDTIPPATFHDQVKPVELISALRIGAVTVRHAELRHGLHSLSPSLS